MTSPLVFCPVCRGVSRHEADIGNVYGEFRVMICGACGLSFIAGPPPAEKCSVIYGDDYYDETLCARINPLREEAEREVVKEQARMLSSFMKVPGRMLDIGCGDGVHLKLFREMGWEVQGTEISEANAAYIRGKYGIEVRVGDIKTLPLERDFFDVVQLRHVIEHVNDPVETLRHVRTLLRPGGIVCLDTPNRGMAGRLYPAVDRFASFLGRMLKGRRSGPAVKGRGKAASWGNLSPPEHNLWFTRKAVRKLFCSAGYEMAWIKTTYRGDPKHYPSKGMLRGEKPSSWEKGWLMADMISSRFGAGNVLVAYGRKPETS